MGGVTASLSVVTCFFVRGVMTSTRSAPDEIYERFGLPVETESDLVLDSLQILVNLDNIFRWVAP